MPDPEPTPPELPDIRVLSITLEPPLWIPQVEYGEDLDDYGALGVLRMAARMLEERLLDACLVDDEEDDE